MLRHDLRELFGHLARAHDERRLGDRAHGTCPARDRVRHSAPEEQEGDGQRSQLSPVSRSRRARAATGRSTTNGTVALARSHPASAESRGGDPRRTRRVDVQPQQDDRGIGDAPRGDAHDHDRRRECARIGRRDAHPHEPCDDGCTARIPRPPPDRTVGCVLRCPHVRAPLPLLDTGEHRIAPGHDVRPSVPSDHRWDMRGSP